MKKNAATTVPPLYKFSLVAYTHDATWAGIAAHKCGISVQFLVNGKWTELKPFITAEVLPLEMVKVNYTLVGARPTKLHFVNTTPNKIDGWATTSVKVEVNRRLATCVAEGGPKKFYWVKDDKLVMDIPAPSPDDPLFTRPADIPEVTVQAGSAGAKIETLTSYPYSFVQQADGNICVYEEGVPGVVWSSGTAGQPTGQTELVLQGDGNLVSYNEGRAVWASHTAGRGSGPYRLVMQQDANVVLYSGDQPLWATGIVR